VCLAHKLWAVKKKYKVENRLHETAAIAAEQRVHLNAYAAKAESEMIRYCHPTRRLDWLCMEFHRAMLIKMNLIIDYPHGLVPTKEMPTSDRHRLLQSSVDIISATQRLTRDGKLGDWGWYFRGFMQWHSVAVVIAELGRSQNPQFAAGAWAVLQPILRTWDTTYAAKRDEPAWDAVNALIERARGMRTAGLQQAGRGNGTRERPIATQQWQPETQPNTSPVTHPQVIVPPQVATRPAKHISTAMCFESDEVLLQAQPPPQNTAPIPPPTTYEDMTAMSTFDIGNFDDWDTIDFSAFDAVFGDPTWDSSTSLDSGWEGLAT